MKLVQDSCIYYKVIFESDEIIRIQVWVRSRIFNSMSVLWFWHVCKCRYEILLVKNVNMTK